LVIVVTHLAAQWTDDGVQPGHHNEEGDGVDMLLLQALLARARELGVADVVSYLSAADAADPR